MECGNCTACCRDLELHEIPSAIGELCKHCTEDGCSIYEDRPEECKKFRCMWLQMENAGKELRPDICGVIFSRKSDDIIAGRLATGRKLNSLVMGQINSFKCEGFSVIIFRDNHSKLYNNKDHSPEYVLGKVHGGS